jgi:hypothetical protein
MTPSTYTYNFTAITRPSHPPLYNVPSSPHRTHRAY